MNRQEQIAACAAAYYMLAAQYLKRKKKKHRRWWMTPLYKGRTRCKAADIIADLRREPSSYFENFCRMSATDFEYFINKVGPIVTKTDTNMRESIPVHDRLAVALKFLSTGESFRSLSFLFKFSTQTVSRCVGEVCQALIEELRDQIKLPKGPEEWSSIAKEFELKWNFPHCLGVIDGRRILLQSTTEFVNNRGPYSMVLMALVDADYRFIYADVGTQNSDDRLFENTTFCKKLNEKQLMLPPSEMNPSGNVPLPYVFIADDPVPSTNHILKPFSEFHKDSLKAKHIFNQRLSRAQQVAENVFGVMSCVFRVLRKSMLVEPSKAMEVVSTCVLLHNFLIKSSSSGPRYSPQGTFDSEIVGEFEPGTWRNNQASMGSFLPLRKVVTESEEDTTFRDSFVEYFERDA